MSRRASPHDLLLLLLLLLLLSTAFAAGCARRFHWPPRALARAAARLPALGEARVELTRSAAMALELRLPFAATLERSAQRSEPGEGVLGELRLGADGLRTPVRLRRIGNFSQLVCSYPKLLLSLPRPRSGPSRAWVLLSHCNDRSTQFLDARHLEAMRLAFALHAAFELPTLRVRRVRVDYVDSAATGKSRRARAGLVTEHVRDLAARRAGGLSRFRLSGAGRLAELDADATARLHLFQILINNADWKLYDLQPLARYFRTDVGRRYLHNMIVLEPRGKKPLPAGFDFDISTLVGMPPGIADLSGGTFEQHLRALIAERFLARAPPLARWATLQLLHFLQRHPAAAVRRALKLVASKRAAFEALIAGAAALSEATKKRARAHVAALFRAIAECAKLWRVKSEGVPLYAEANGQRRACGALPAGTALQLAAAAASRPARSARVRVRLVQVVRVRAGRGFERLCSGGGAASAPASGFVERTAIEPLMRR